MIERLAVGLHALTILPPGALQSTEGRRLAGDCADAVRLALDCPQHDLTVDQRDALRAVGDLLESSDAREADLRAALRSARLALGLHSSCGRT